MLRLGHPLWQAAHRPLFFCAGLCALWSPVVWLWPIWLGWGGVADPVRWHLHELMFGMAGAAVGGYLLTALPGWTGAGRVSPQSVRALTLLWVLARFAWPLEARLPIGLLLVLSLGYFGALALILARHLIAARVWRRLWFVAAVGAMALGDAAVLTGARGMPTAPAAPLVMVVLFATLIGIIGGRAVPAFTRSWLEQSGQVRQVRDSGVLFVAAITATVFGGGLVLAGMLPTAGACLLLAGALHGARMIGWQTLRARLYPALFMLHLAWLWLPVGLILLGAALLRPELLPHSAALHALTMGAKGGMIQAIAGRAAMVRQDGRLLAGRGLAVAFVLVWLAALVRVAGPIVPQGWPDPVMVSAAMWMLGWAVWLWAFRPALQGVVPWPILSARRRDTIPPPDRQG